MKKLLVVLMVLAMATIANAELKIWVDDFDPSGSPVILMASQTAKISIVGDGGTFSPQWLFMVVTPEVPLRGGSISGGGIVMSNPDLSRCEFTYHTNKSEDIVYLMWMLGYEVTSTLSIFPASSLVPTPNYSGTIVDNILFTALQKNTDVTLSLLSVYWTIIGYDDDGFEIFEPHVIVFDTQVIHTPEPMTMALLGLGGLGLLRKR